MPETKNKKKKVAYYMNNNNVTFINEASKLIGMNKSSFLNYLVHRFKDEK